MSDILDVQRSLGRIEGQLGQLLETLKDHSADDRQWHQQIDTRMRRLEESRAHNAGRQSVATALISTVVAGVVAWMTKHFA